jgi:DNA-binding ferritin-like protein
MSYVKEFLVQEEESVEEQEPTLADDIRSIIKPLYDPHPTYRDINYQIMDLVKTSEDKSADEMATELDRIVEKILKIQKQVHAELPVEWRTK